MRTLTSRSTHCDCHCARSCLREVQATVDQQKPILCTHEADPAKGGGPLKEIKIELDQPRLLDAVFAEERLVTIWYRIYEFQLVSLKQMAAFMLLQTPQYKEEETLDIVPGELLQKKLGFENPVTLYASPHNSGALALAAELRQAYPGISATLRRTACEPSKWRHGAQHLERPRW